MPPTLIFAFMTTVNSRVNHSLAERRKDYEFCGGLIKYE